MSDYPIPSYAAYIWTTGDQLWIAFPGENGARGHSVPFPNNEVGLSVALEALRERSRCKHNYLSTAGAPTRRQVEEQVKRDKRYNEILRALESDRAGKAKEAAEAAEFLKELGL